MDRVDSIKLFGPKDPYFKLSNFYLSPVEMDGKVYPSTEHAYHPFGRYTLYIKRLSFWVKLQLKRDKRTQRLLEKSILPENVRYLQIRESLVVISGNSILTQPFENIKMLKYDRTGMLREMISCD